MKQYSFWMINLTESKSRSPRLRAQQTAQFAVLQRALLLAFVRHVSKASRVPFEF
jgi:hypothetical protein